jgi:hypothetical protein
MRKPARQHPLDQTEELTVRRDPHRRLTDRQRDQLSIRDLRRTARTSSDRILVREHIACNNKGFQIGTHSSSYLEGTPLEALLRQQTAGPCERTRRFTSSL